MKKIILGVVMVVVFCITWWLVAGEAWQASRAEHGKGRKFEGVVQEAHTLAEWENIKVADAHLRTQASWGTGAGLLADVLLLVGALAWSKLTAKA